MFEFKEELSTDNILKRISDYGIFKFYCPSFNESGKKFSSELREDSIPSAIITEYKGKLWYKDFGESIPPVDCFGYVMRKFSQTFQQALNTINIDFNLGFKSYIDIPTNLEYLGFPEKLNTNFKKTIYSASSSNIKQFIPVYRDWLEYDIKYWKNRYYLDKYRLKFFEIYPIKAVEIEGKLIQLDFPSYIYIIDKKILPVYKIYSPFSKLNKWLSNCKSYHYQGLNQLPWTGKELIITKSLKDIAVLSLFKLAAIAPQSESQIISYEMYTQLKKRFEKFYVLYDNDRAGVEGAKQTVECYKDIIPIFIPIESGVKDISDFINKYRYKETEKLIKTLL